MKFFMEKLKESVFSVLPVVALILVLELFGFIWLTTQEIVLLLVTSITIILGICLFNLGAELSISKMGEQVGSGLTKKNRIFLLVFICFLLGVLITIAEPDLQVLAKQAKDVIDGNTLILVIGLGVGVFLSIGIIKMILKIDLVQILMFFYFLAFAVATVVIENGNGSLIPLAFDSGGVTTGPITVPFLMALGVSVSQGFGGKDSQANSFGMVALGSIGPILMMLVMLMFSNGDVTYSSDFTIDFANIGKHVIEGLGHVSGNVLSSLAMLVGFFILFNFVFLKLPMIKLIKMGIGILYTFVGLVLFLASAEIAFMPLGFKIGQQLALNPIILIAAGFLIGFLVILAEPAVKILVHQVEDITEGSVSKKSMFISLCIGVGIAIALSLVRVVFNFPLLYIIVPGYFLSLGLSFFVPRIYTAIAFDSGGVASGPLTSSFILSLLIGACVLIQGNDNIMSLAFGVVSLVAMTPLITIQLLGFKSFVSLHFRKSTQMRRIINSEEDCKIINFR